MGLRLTANAETPVPDNGTSFGLLEALVVNVSAADRTPVAGGVNVTLTAQLAPAARVPPQVFAEMVKSAAFGPVRAMLAMVSVADPVFVSVTDCEEVVTPTIAFPNDRLDGLKLTAGAEVKT